MTPEAKIALAMLIRAIRDARAGNGHAAPARAWLRSPDALGLALTFGLDPEILGGYVEALPPAKQPMIPDLFCDVLRRCGDATE
jgi:hypothetical protein